MVVGEKRLVGAEELAYIRGVVNGGVEVGVVFGNDGLVEDGARHGEHQRGDETLLFGISIGAGLDGLEEAKKMLAESGPCDWAAAHERVEVRSDAGGLDACREIAEEMVVLEVVEVEDECADAYAQMRRRVWRVVGHEGAVWKRLQGEADGGFVGGADPAGVHVLRRIDVHEAMTWPAVWLSTGQR